MTPIVRHQFQRSIHFGLYTTGSDPTSPAGGQLAPLLRPPSKERPSALAETAVRLMEAKKLKSVAK